jgi:hypothetical protein
MNSGRTDLASVTADLNSGNIQIVRDTFKSQAPARNAMYADSARRYGGARQAAETHSNGALTVSLYTTAASADAAVNQWESLLGTIEGSGQTDYFIKWKPEGATNATFYEVRGSASWQANYRWLEFSQNRVVVFEVSWSVAPLAQGPAITFSSSSSAYPANLALPTASGYSVSVPGTAPALLDLDVAKAAGFTVSSATASTTTYTYTTSAAHNFVVGNWVTVAGASIAAYNGSFAVTAVTSTTFAVTGPVSAPGTPTFSSGSVSEDTNFAMVGWSKHPSATVDPANVNAPFGLIDIASGGTGLSVSNMTYGTGPTRALIANPTFGTSYYLGIDIDPSTIQRDDFTRNEVQLEVWARMGVTSAQTSVSVVTSLESKASTGATSRYTAEYGNTGKLLEVANGIYYYRLGTVPAVVDPNNKAVYTLKIAPVFGATYTGAEFSIDHVVILPARQRALTPTDRKPDSTYPKFISRNASTSAVKKTVRSDLSGWISTGSAAPYPDSGLGGQLLEIPAGNVDLFVKGSNGVPDDTTIVDDATQTLTITGTIIPRYFLGRGTN